MPFSTHCLKNQIVTVHFGWSYNKLTFLTGYNSCLSKTIWIFFLIFVYLLVIEFWLNKHIFHIIISSLIFYHQLF